MDFKDILVHIDNSQQCANRLELAIILARKHKAHLTGIYVVTHSHYAPQTTETMKSRITEAESIFRQKTGDAGISAEWLLADWATVGVDMVEVLNYHAHTKDLIIIGQVEQGKHEGNVPADLPERVVLGAGRPVLVVPYAGTFSTVGKRVVVAWKAGRASARAVNDAMPFMLGSEEVHVLSITVAGEPEAATQPDGDLRTNLERHDIKVKTETIPTENPVANVLMNYAWDHGCDLIVMGAYAHSPRGSLYLGPVAKQLLNSMTVPVLMSH
jgi:nucleotide-binding universal stress UspA family protein